MKRLKVINKETGAVVASNVRLANDLVSKTIGLMFKSKLDGMDGLMLQPCNSIHTFFMRMPIDVVFISANNEVIKVFRSLPPWRMTWMYLRAVKTLEMAAGTLPLDLQEGNRLEVVYV